MSKVNSRVQNNTCSFSFSLELETDKGYIRRPEEAVISKVVESHGAKQRKQDEIVMDPRDDAYESHRSITKSPAAISMMRKRKCHLNELKELKEKVCEVSGPRVVSADAEEHAHVMFPGFEDLPSICRVSLDASSGEKIPLSRLENENLLAPPANVSIEKAVKFI